MHKALLFCSAELKGIKSHEVIGRVSFPAGFLVALCNTVEATEILKQFDGT